MIVFAKIIAPKIFPNYKSENNKNNTFWDNGTIDKQRPNTYFLNNIPLHKIPFLQGDGWVQIPGGR